MRVILLSPRWRSGLVRPRAREGITILEVLVALVAIVCVAGVLLVVIARHRELAQRVQCKNNLKVIGEAMRAYHDASAGDDKLKRLPPSQIAEDHATWAVLLAPHLSKEHALAQWDPLLPYVEQKEESRQARLVFFFCPTRERADTLSILGDQGRGTKHLPGGLGDYACVAGDGSIKDWTGPEANGALVGAIGLEFKEGKLLRWGSATNYASITRGEAYTILIGEKHVPPDGAGDAAFGDGSFYNGANPASFARVAGPGFPLAPSIAAPFNRNFGSAHNAMCNFLNADGSVRTMPVTTDAAILGELSHREVEP
jgi:hypothetical protein